MSHINYTFIFVYQKKNHLLKKKITYTIYIKSSKGDKEQSVCSQDNVMGFSRPHRQRSKKSSQSRLEYTVNDVMGYLFTKSESTVKSECTVTDVMGFSKHTSGST